MKPTDYIQIILYILALLTLAPALGLYIAKVFENKGTFLSGFINPIEKWIYKSCGIDHCIEMTWKEYAKSLVMFNFIGFVFLLLILALQKYLPFNPQSLDNLSWHLNFNTAISFVTNTNWQSYGGESTMSYLSQMLGLTVQNFLSAATGLAVFVALVRGIIRRQTSMIGNFWVDIVKSILHILLPLSFIMAVVLVSQGVIQNFNPYEKVKTLEGLEQIIPQGSVASQVAIKQLGTNGGGYFNANSAHPYENPTPFSNFLQMLAILLIPASLVFTYGKMIGSFKQGVLIFAVMFGVWFAGLVGSCYSEYKTTPTSIVSQNLEGKEVRFGVVNSIIWSTVTTVASNGSVNSMHSSLTPLSGGIAIFNIMLGEIIFGGVGSGMYGMLLFILLTVFLSGLMVGRSPEYLGKKVEAFEMKWSILGILGPCAVILLGTAVSVLLPTAVSSLSSKGPHGFSEILYAFTSAAGNNGSAFAGLNANVPYYNVMLGIAMLIGRFVVIIPCLAIAGNMALKKYSPPSAGTFATDNSLFAALLIGVILIVGALTFLPALALGPIIEHFLMTLGQSF